MTTRTFRFPFAGLPPVHFKMFLTAFCFALPLLANGPVVNAQQQEPKTVTYFVDGELEAPAQFGLDQLTKQLQGKGVKLVPAEAGAKSQILIGVHADSAKIRELAAAGKCKLAENKEALVVARIENDGNSTLLIAGIDSTGLMYALLDLADQVEHASSANNWPQDVAERSESPKNSMRRMRVLFHHKKNEDWYRSREYWDWYIGMLATNRFNGLNLVYSHQTSYMAPMYAWHVKVKEFPNIKPTDITEEERKQNLEIIKYISRTCRDRGIELTIGVWQHLPWKKSYLESRNDQVPYVEGLDHTNVKRYSYLAMKQLLEECPGIARIQLRPNDESGIHMGEQTRFYRDNVMKAIKDSPRDVKLDLRTVGVKRSTIEAARQAELDVRISIKYFGEFLGLPFTPQEVLTRGYSYSDYLEKPFENPYYNEVWMLGSHRVLLMGSEDYGRRFGQFASYGGTIGFETDGPVAQKGYQDPQSPAWRSFKNKEDEYFDHEIERYWAFFRMTGRFTYNPSTDREVWMRPFRSRFGKAAEPMARAYEEASQVISLICASHVANTNMYVWPEISMGGLIPAYMELRGTDKGLFPNIVDQVRAELAGVPSGRLGARRLADHFQTIAENIEQALQEAASSSVSDTKEYRATVKDFRILAELARYHAHRQREGYLMAKFNETGDASLLPTAKQECESGIATWARLVEIANNHYYDKMLTAPIENGHWNLKTRFVEANRQIVQDAEDALHTHGLFDYGFDFGSPANSQHLIVFGIHNYGNHYFDQPRFTSMSPDSRYHPDRRFGFSMNDGLKAWDRKSVSYNSLTGTRPDTQGPLPIDILNSDFVQSEKPFRFRVDMIPMDKYRYTMVLEDKSRNPKDHGPMTISAVTRRSKKRIAADVTVPAGERVIKQSTRWIRHSWYPFCDLEFAPSKEGADAIVSAISVHRDRLNMAHAPERRLDPSQPISLSVTITAPPQPVGESTSDVSASSKEELVDAKLFYRTKSQGEFRSAPLASEDGFIYAVDLPQDATAEGTELDYYFQATDQKGHVSRSPKSVGRDTFFHTDITSDATPPKLVHEPVLTCPAGKPLKIQVNATDPAGVEVVRVYFRPMRQSLPYESIVLRRKGDTYEGVIPGDSIVDDFDFVYYLEAVDSAGNGAIYPNWLKDRPYIIVRTTAE